MRTLEEMPARKGLQEDWRKRFYDFQVLGELVDPFLTIFLVICCRKNLDILYW